MTSAQKTIKYVAIGFAIFLIVTIISAILSAIYGLAIGLGLVGDAEENTNYDYYKYDDLSTYLDIELGYTNLTIHRGDNLLASSNNKNISISQDGNKLIIKENTKNIFRRNRANNLEISIPENLNFEIVDIRTGAGEVDIADVITQNLNLELGAGKTNIKNIQSATTTIETGAGSVKITDANLNNLKLELGIGEVSFNGIITGRSSIESGIGSVKLNLNQSVNEYTFDIDKGIGSITINGASYANDGIIGTGNNYLKIDGGIGSVAINTLR